MPTRSVENRTGFDETYRYHTFQGSTFVRLPGSQFPDKPYKNNLKIDLNRHILNEYLPVLNKLLPNAPKGMILLLTAMTYQEGFYPGTRSYSNNNPGNIGNTDNGKNVPFPTLEAGVKKQIQHLQDIVAGKLKAYPMGKLKTIEPTWSKEIAKNTDNYQMSPWLPGYVFTFTGQLDQYVKIYALGARAGNNYINRIISYFRKNGIMIGPESKIQDIIKMAA